MNDEGDLSLNAVGGCGGSESVVGSESRFDPSQDVSANRLSTMFELGFKMEVQRCISLRNYAGLLLTCSSIISVALLAVAEPLYSCFSPWRFWSMLLVAVYAASLISLALSVLFAVLSQIRFAYRALPDPESLYSNIEMSAPFSKWDAVKHLCESLQPIYASLEHRSDIMRMLLRGSSICVVVAISVLLFGGVVLLIFFFSVVCCD